MARLDASADCTADSQRGSWRFESSYESFCVGRFIPFNPCSEIKNLPIADVEQGYTPTVDEIYRLLDEAHYRNFVDDVAHQTYVGDERDLKTWMWHHLLLRLCAETGIRIACTLT